MRTRLLVLFAVIVGITAVVLWFTVVPQFTGSKAGSIVGRGIQVVGVDLNGPFVQIDGGGDHSLALRKDGSVVAWGNNDDGQCDVPKPNKDFVAIAAGTAHSLAIRASRTSFSP
ncbi:MAG: hypothetical protein QHH26_01405 [Armatimonadota bacterium]|nr:hypothetical protein [Armatimonadota bacterium]